MNRRLRVNALRYLGYIARVHRRLDLVTVLPLLRAASTNADPEVAATAGDALDAIQTLLPGAVDPARLRR